MAKELTIRRRLVELIADHFDKAADDLNDEMRFIEDLDADSLDALELTMDCEDEFGITIADEDAQRFLTIGQAAGWLQKRLEGGET